MQMQFNIYWATCFGRRESLVNFATYFSQMYREHLKSELKLYVLQMTRCGT